MGNGSHPCFIQTTAPRDENYVPPVPPSPPPAAQIAPEQTTFAPNLYPDPPTQPTAVVASPAPAVPQAAPPPAGPQAPLPRSTRRSSAHVGAVSKAALTAWEGIWYVLMCVPFGAAYFSKIPAKKALSDFGLVQMTKAEQFWYVIQCIFFGAGYFAKIPTAKALSELPQVQSHVQANLTQLGQ